ncbi:hypothetical protein LTR99_005614 [Exophiala xenobiotica]|uniref:Phosphoglycerate mutase n=1 Tax=Vermiconidia calcicola TaxID=1690605 RepID=A0AAV9QF48_9PEZI|nr:hypothetical protein LTR96_004731 [Exophiala xenobiotica]KAK5540240.1 hypothetical protein LTR23_006337 [Chaetothyriales sp. CCFEE 6169]KAK5541312.1 hypothetical protein LTR25_003089 [Vermiconidia calcicola]KAK5302657.1 hypothetical protein LTR99_005614 [Exophiala xenobiotica]KAK5340352.1 hypothetical protein LTR98_003474 [Exophiala xenobiotica]
MSAKDAKTPRVFLIRHGETEWSKNGRYTGITDLALLPEGEDKVRQTASVIFGRGRLIDPHKLGMILCSPRNRAQQTMKLFLDQIPDLDWNLRNYVEALIRTTEDLAEWGYGDYEGLLTEQIRELRSSRGLDTTRPWQIMRDGCEGPGGEAPAQVEQRLDRIISKITSYQESMMEPYSINDPAHNVVLFGHGHILRAFVKRWLGFNIDAPIKLDFQFEPGSVCGLSYAHGDFNDRVLLAGMRFPVPPREDPDYDSDEHNYC